MKNRMATLVVSLTLMGAFMLGATATALATSRTGAPIRAAAALTPAPANANGADVEGGIFIAHVVGDDMVVIGDQDGYSGLRLDLSHLNRTINFLRTRITDGTRLICRPDGVWVILNPANGGNAVTLNVRTPRTPRAEDPAGEPTAE